MLYAVASLLAIGCSQKHEPKALVLYYSQTGNTQAVAELIASITGADIEVIVPVVPYDGDYAATIERAGNELFGKNFPEVQPVVTDIAKYDVIFLGFPVWYGTYAPPVETVLNTLDLAGKKIIPFCTFGSGGIDTSSKNLAEKLAESEILPGYGVRAARMDAMPTEVQRFLVEAGFAEGEYEPLPAFSETVAVTEGEAAIFDAAVAGYAMINAKATEVASRQVPGGQEYLFTAADLSGNADAEPKTIKVYVLVEEGKSPVFTQVCR